MYETSMKSRFYAEEISGPGYRCDDVLNVKYYWNKATYFTDWSVYMQLFSSKILLVKCVGIWDKMWVMFVKYLFMFNNIVEIFPCGTRTSPSIAIKRGTPNHLMFRWCAWWNAYLCPKLRTVLKSLRCPHTYFPCQFPIGNWMQFALIAPTVLVDIVFNNGKCNRVVAQKWLFRQICTCLALEVIVRMNVLCSNRCGWRYFWDDNASNGLGMYP